MGTLTSFIFIGYSHPNHGGINPTHCISLSENSRPCLVLRNIDGKEIDKVIPTVECMVDDIYFMIYNSVLKLYKQDFIFNGKEMYSLFNSDERNGLYNEVKTKLVNLDLKIVFNILDGSSLLNRIDDIKNYLIDYEVTIPKIRREYSHSTKKVEINEY